VRGGSRGLHVRQQRRARGAKLPYWRLSDVNPGHAAGGGYSDVPAGSSFRSYPLAEEDVHMAIERRLIEKTKAAA
jgi:hypothetical protein